MSKREYPRHRHVVDPSARRIDLAISSVLGWGIAISVVLMVLGIVGYLATLYMAGNVLSAQEIIFSGRGVFVSPTDLARGVDRRNPATLEYAGLFVLALLPLAPVILSLFGYITQRDRAFVAITTFLLVLLLASIASGMVS